MQNKQRKNIHMIYAWLLIWLCLFSPLHLANATPGKIDKQDVYQLLKSGTHEAVRALPPGQRDIFLATIAMNKGDTKKALGFLTAKTLKKNRLASLIKAEAYRRQSVQAADRAGHYAHAVNKDIGKLKQAGITTGLDEANAQLDAFLISLNKPKVIIAIPASIPEPVTAPTPIQSVTVQAVTVQTIEPTSLIKPVVIALARPKRDATPPTSPPAVVEPSKPIVVNVLPAQPDKSKPVKLKLAKLQPIASRSVASRSVASQSVASQSVTAKAMASESAHEAIETWRKDWQSLNSNAYLSHYHKAFKTLKHDYASWVQYKRRVNGKKSYIKISLSNVKIIPSSEALKAGEAVLVTFDQQYQSSNYNAVSRKQIYMARKNSSSPWLILYEGDSN